MLQFKEYSGNKASFYEEAFITNVLKDLTIPQSYYTNLQLQYNSSKHFTTCLIDLCTYDKISDLTSKVFSPNKIVTVHGTIHHNYHQSNILFDIHTNKQAFVEDAYIRVSYCGIMYHILVSPPKLLNCRECYYSA